LTVTSSSTRLPSSPRATGESIDVALVGADDAVRLPLAVLVLDVDPRAEEHALRIARQVADDDHVFEPLRQEPHPPIDLAQALLAVDVLGVLAAVAHRRRIGHVLRDARTLLQPQLIELVAKLLRALRRDVTVALLDWPGAIARPHSLPTLTVYAARG
jgi:hypothetical protein